MGTYASRADVVPGLIEETIAVQLTQDDGSDETVDYDVVDDAIAEAESIIDGYVGARYDLTSVHGDPPDLLGRLAARLAKVILYKRRPGALSDELQRAEDSAMRMLRDLSQGHVSLGVQPQPSPDSERRLRSGGSSRRLSRSHLEEW